MSSTTQDSRSERNEGAIVDAASATMKDAALAAAALAVASPDPVAAAAGVVAAQQILDQPTDAPSASGVPGQAIKKIVKVFMRTENGAWERVRAVAEVAESSDETVRQLATALKPWGWGKSKISEMALLAKAFPKEIVRHDLSVDFHENV